MHHHKQETIIILYQSLKLSIYIYLSMKKQELVKKKKYRRKFFDITDGYSLVKFINKIPKLEQIKFRLSQQQCNVVGENQNLIVIGRSGTGKTTCALMRMFSIQILYKDTKAKQKHIASGKTDKYYCKSQFLDEVYGIHNIFLTASPLLISQISSKYEQLKNHLKKQLDTLENRKSYLLVQSKTEQQLAKFDMKEINNAEDAAKKRQNKYNSFHNLEEVDFPGFFTVKEFLVMFDGILMNNFFVRGDRRRRILNAKDVEVDIDKKMHKIRMNNKEYFAKECKWQTFSTQFWDKDQIWQIIKIRKKYLNIEIKQITAISVWTQILSTIKGDFSSHTYRQRYLPRAQYLQRKSKMFKREQKQIIYDIFLKYEGWKNNSQTKYYDCLDLSNHLLYNAKQFFQYSNQEHIFINNQPSEFNYLFLDQIQDLPPVVPYLISQVFTDGLYFSGDSAQAIQKGIAFKFADLKFMFHQSFEKNNLCSPLFFQEPKIHKLTVNFRSHQNILNLANSLIGMLQKLFPQSIDRLQKEQSPVDGPKPIYLTFDQTQEAIHRLLLDVNSKTLQCNSVIIVRDHEGKNKLPENIKILKGITLTIQQAKGMEFDDVIMYNFFNPKLSPLWKILKYLQVYPQQGERRHINQIQITDYQQLITEIKLIYTLVTRAKCTLMICQDNIPKELLIIWQYMGLLGTFKDMLNTRHERDLYISKVKKSGREITWQERGYVFLIQKKYDLALQCYENANKPDVCNKIKGTQRFQQAIIDLKKLRETYSAQKYQKEYSQQQLNDLIPYKKYKEQCKSVYKKLEDAGELFEKAKIYTNAGHAYYLGCYFDRALQNYLLGNVQEEDYYKIGTCYKKSKRGPLIDNLKEASVYFRKGLQYSEMIEVLQMINDDEFSFREISQCDKFQGRQIYYHKYAQVYINKKYGEIDKKIQVLKLQENNQKIDYDFQIKISNFGLFKCQNQIKDIKSKINNHKSITLLVQVENLIKSFVLKLKQDMYKQQAYEKYVHFRQHVEKLQLKILQIRQSINRIRDDDVLKMTKQQIIINSQYLAELKKCLTSSSREFEIQCREMIQKTTFPEDIVLKLKDLLKNIQSLLTIEFINYSKTLLLYMNERSFVKSQSEQILKQIKKQLNEVGSRLRSMILFLQQYLKLEIKNIIKQRNTQQQNVTAVNYLEKYLCFSKLDQYKLIINSYQRQFEKRFNHLIKQQNKNSFQLIYQKKIKQNHPPILVHLTNNILKQQQQQILKELLSSKPLSELKVFQDQQILPMDQRRQLQAIQSKLSCFGFINHIVIQRQYSTNPEKRKRISRIKFLSRLSARSVIGISTLFNIGQKAIQGLIGQLSYYSVCYTSKATYGAKQRRLNNEGPIIQLINPSFFNFPIYRTIQRYQSCSNELVQAVILLGLADKFEKLFSQNLNLKIWLAFMNQTKVNQYLSKYQTQKLRQKCLRRFDDDYEYQRQWDYKLPFDEQTLDNLRSFILISQYFQMDKWQQPSWFIKENLDKESYKKLKDESIKKQSKDVLQRYRAQAEIIASSMKQQMRHKLPFIKKYFPQYLLDIKRYSSVDQVIREYKYQISLFKKIMIEIRKRVPNEMIRQQSEIFDVYHITRFVKESNIMIDQPMHLNEVKNVCIPNNSQSCKSLQQEFIKQKRKYLQPLLNIYRSYITSQEVFIQEDYFCSHRFDPHLNDNYLYLQLLQDTRYAQQLINLFQKSIEKFNKVNAKINQIENFISNITKSYLHKIYDDIKKKYCYVNITIKRIFLSQNPNQLINHFNQLCRSNNSKQNRISILLCYISFKNNKRVSSLINQRIKDNIFKDNIDRITSILLFPLASSINYQYYTDLLQIFGVKTISNCLFMSIFRNMVIVPIKLIEYLRIKNHFCYRMSGNGENYLMKFEEISTIMSQTVLKSFFLYKGQRYNLSLIKDGDFVRMDTLKGINTNLKMLLQRILRNKYHLITFYYQNNFISHQSCIFIYSQLKQYYDLIVIAQIALKYQNEGFQKHMINKIDMLQKQFEKWGVYAKFEIKKDQ